MSYDRPSYDRLAPACEPAGLSADGFKMAELVESELRGEAYNRETKEETTPRQHKKCLSRLSKACSSSSYVRFMLEAMKKLGCDVDPEKHIVCEPCDTTLLGGYDPFRKEIFLCENTIYSQKTMDDILTHELIHAYDDCRVQYDPHNLKHLACTEIRAANLSGDCFFWKETFGRFKFGWKAHQQACVKERATKSMLCVRDITKKEAEEVIDSVFESCFNDTEPFERIPP